MSEKMHMPDDNNNSVALKYIIGTCVFVVALYGYWSATNRNTDVATVQNTLPVVSEVDTSDSIQDEQVTLDATLLEISEDASFIRVGTPDRGIVSVGISAETNILMNDTAVAVTALPPLSKISIDARELTDTEMYDFSAVSVSVTFDDSKVLEQKAQEMIDLNLVNKQ